MAGRAAYPVGGIGTFDPPSQYAARMEFRVRCADDLKTFYGSYKIEDSAC
jgi:hypothetical protein